MQNFQQLMTKLQERHWQNMPIALLTGPSHRCSSPMQQSETQVMEMISSLRNAAEKMTEVTGRMVL